MIQWLSTNSKGKGDVHVEINFENRGAAIAKGIVYTANRNYEGHDNLSLILL